jgi:hypothetical protein
MGKTHSKPEAHPGKPEPPFSSMAGVKASMDSVADYFLPSNKLWRQIIITLFLLLSLWIGTMYGISQWYIAKHRDEPLQLGTTFIAPYAEYFGLDPHETLDAILGDLKIRHIRFVSYWDQMEPSRGTYNFSSLDWQFAEAEKYGAKVSLAVGLRQPRWPECHMPQWAMDQPTLQWYQELHDFIQKVVDRYKFSPALDSYQLENEYFLKVFGECTNFDRQRLVDEFNLVKQLDPFHTVIITRSNNALGLPLGQPTPDEFGVSVYKRVWDKTLTHRYFEYPFPAWFYGFLAGAGELLTGRTMIVHELQAEAWTPDKFNGMLNTPQEEQYKSMDGPRLAARIKYGEGTGMRTIDLWGAEWWYWHKVHFNNSGMWNVVKQAVADSQKN